VWKGRIARSFDLFELFWRENGWKRPQIAYSKLPLSNDALFVMHLFSSTYVMKCAEFRAITKGGVGVRTGILPDRLDRAHS
jgi:hypothetical protein